MLQKVLKVGNSLAITLPRHFVKGRKLQAGQKIFVDADADYDMVIIRTTRRGFASLTPEFKKWLDKVTKEHENALRELAKR